MFLHYLRVIILVINMASFLVAAISAMVWLGVTNGNPQKKADSFGHTTDVALRYLVASLACQGIAVVLFRLMIPIVPAVVMYWWMRLAFTGLLSLLFGDNVRKLDP